MLLPKAAGNGIMPSTAVQQVGWRHHIACLAAARCAHAVSLQNGGVATGARNALR